MAVEFPGSHRSKRWSFFGNEWKHLWDGWKNSVPDIVRGPEKLTGLCPLIMAEESTEH